MFPNYLLSNLNPFDAAVHRRLLNVAVGFLLVHVFMGDEEHLCPVDKPDFFQFVPQLDCY